MIHYTKIDSIIGPLTVAGDDHALRFVYFQGETRPDWEPGTPAAVREAVRELRAYFDGALRDFTVPVVPAGTPFQQNVWRLLAEIPYGATISYGELARRTGNPAGSRAVGAANGANPIPIILPCHRVIGANGKLTGYGGGLPIKKRLLEWEAEVAGSQRVLAMGG